MTLLPFICLGIGIFLGLVIKSKRFVLYSEKLSTIALILLMVTIGVGIGIDEKVIKNFHRIGFNCAIITLSAITFSVIFSVIFEKSLLPLEKISVDLKKKNLLISSEEQGEYSDKTLIFLMPGSILIGLVAGIFFQDKISPPLLDLGFIISLTFLYICVGISQGSSKDILNFLKALGGRIILLPLAVLLGSLVGGVVAGKILNIPIYISTISASGMGYYSITGAFMVNRYGLEVGTYGFIVNILREVFTILLLPILIKISTGSPIVSGGAGDMDTMLMPVTKFVGTYLGIVTLITGTILTFLVPFLLPLLASIFS